MTIHLNILKYSKTREAWHFVMLDVWWSIQAVQYTLDGVTWGCIIGEMSMVSRLLKLFSYPVQTRLHSEMFGSPTPPHLALVAIGLRLSFLFIYIPRCDNYCWRGSSYAVVFGTQSELYTLAYWGKHTGKRSWWAHELKGFSRIIGTNSMIFWWLISVGGNM